MPADSFESMAMLDGPDNASIRDLYARLRRRVDRYTFIACFGFTAFLVVFSSSLFNLHSSLSAIRVLLTDAKSPSQASLAAPDQIANRTLGFEEVLVISLPERTDHRDGLILASAVSNIHVNFVDGVRASTISDKAYPPGYDGHLRAGAVGAWRAHISAIDRVVKRGLSSALIMEDDVDWDVRFKDVLKDYARSSNALLNSSPGSIMSLDTLPVTSAAVSSPYGDGWDVLWLGHCGMELKTGDSRVIHAGDATVPETQYLHSWDSKAETPLAIYPNHTRVAMPISEGVCSLAYAVSQNGARSILNSIGLEKLDGAFDIMLRHFCVGENGRQPHRCLGVLPQIFDHHRRKGSGSDDGDIEDHSDTVREKAETPNIRWSVRMNMNKILRGETTYEDQYPDAS